MYEYSIKLFSVNYGEEISMWDHFYVLLSCMDAKCVCLQLKLCCCNVFIKLFLRSATDSLLTLRLLKAPLPLVVLLGLIGFAFRVILLHVS